MGTGNGPILFSPPARLSERAQNAKLLDGHLDQRQNPVAAARPTMTILRQPLRLSVFFAGEAPLAPCARPPAQCLITWARIHGLGRVLSAR